jgi:glycosyltransferase involved in cell wall biosynthesis
MIICDIYSIEWSRSTAHVKNALQNCEALAKEGHVVYLLTPFGRAAVVADRLNLYGIERNFIIRRLACPEPRDYALGGMLARALFCAQAFFIMFIIKPEVVFTRDFSMLYFLSKLPGFLRPKVPVIYEAHKVCSRAAELRKVSEKQEISAIGVAERIVCVTSGIKNDLIELGYPEEKLHVLPNAVELSKFNVKRQADARAHNIIYTGSFIYWKGVDILVDAFALLLKDIPDAKLYLVGDDHEGNRQKIEKQIKERGIENSVEMTGYVSHKEVVRYLVMADVLALPNTVSVQDRYTSPMKVFEYMAARVPIVASALPAIREILDESTAVLVPPGDAKALCDGMLYLLRNPDAGLMLADKAYQRIESDYTWGKRARKIGQIIEKTKG